ncbi:MAG: glycosyltransferase family 4 protein [Chloroflexi bacterium]|nr:glycosyltransferase family 4 protein [Chloroflexota bacterium]
MNIALVSPYDFAHPGGVANHIQQLAQQFTRAGHTVKILAPSSKSPSALGIDNLVHLGRPIPVPSNGSIARITVSLWLLPRIKALLEREHFDIIHLHEPLTPFLPLAFLRYSRSVNVGTFHAYRPGSKIYWLARPVLNHWVRRLQGRIAVSRPARDFVRSYFPGDYTVIPNGIDVEHFARGREPLPEFNDGKLNLLFVGRLEKRKGLKHLLGAYSRLKWEYPNLRLIVVGPGNLDKDCYRLMGERNLKDVVFTGGVPYQDLPRFYHSAHIFCAPATGKESFGIVLLEAMTAGVPIVASRIEGYASVVQEGAEGLLVPPKDDEALAEGIRRLIVDAALREALGQRGQAKAREYRWERVASQVMEYYLATLGHASTSTVTAEP